MIDSINKLAWKAVDAVEAGLSSAPPSSLGITLPSDPIATAELEAKIKLEIESGAHKLETLLGSTIDKNFDKLEIFALRTIVAVPEGLEDWIRLRHYDGLDFGKVGGEDGDRPTVESVREQRAKVVEAQRLQRLLVAESRKNEVIIAKLRALRGMPRKQKKEGDVKEEDLPYPVFKHLEDKAGLGTGAAETPLTTTTAFALSQMPALKSLLAELKPMEQALEEKKVLGEDGEKVWRTERVEYIESQTRRHLETRGLELDANGEVRDGEWQGGGRRLNKGEVEGLEAVVALMGGEKEVKEEEDENMFDA